jgi:hypothetical protein
MNGNLTLDDLKDGAVYTVKEAATVLRESPGSVYNAIHRGDLVASKTAGFRILGRDIKAFWERKKAQPKEGRQGAPSPRQGEHRPLKHIRLKTGG